MKDREDIIRRYEDLRQKKEALRVSISNLHDRLTTKKAKLKEINLRCNKLERYLYPEQKLDQTKAQRFQRLAKRILPAKMYENMLREA